MSIRVKLTIMFLAIALIPLLFVSNLTYTNYKKSLEANRLSQLQDLTVFRANSIETYFSGIKSHMKITQSFYNIKQNLPVLIRLSKDPDNPEFLAAKKTLDGQLRQMQSVSKLSDIMLINPQGKTVYSSNNPLHLSKDMSKGNDAEQKAFSRGKDKAYFSDVYFDKAEDNRYEMLLTAPAFDFKDGFIGVIAFEVDMTPVYDLIQDTTGLGRTGEVLVARKIGNQVEYLNPLRHEPNTIMKRINIGEKIGGPIQKAVQGKTGVGIGIDYRGEKVIAAWRYIPSLDWGLVAKIDTEEAFADVTNLRNLSIIIIVIIFVLAGVAAFSIARSISEPIKQLAKGAQIVGSGNLDCSVATDSKDEIGELSRTFDKMTQDLKTTTASRDELNIEIDERKQAEESLRQSREDLNRAQAVAHSGSWRMNVQKNELTWSDENHRIFGIPKEKPMTYETFLSAVHPDDLEYVDKAWKAALQGKPYDIEHRIVAGGKIKWVRERANLELDKNGKLLGGFGTTQDITERKAREEELRRLNRTLRAISNSNQAMMHSKDESQFLKEVCDIIVKDCGHKMAWIGFAQDDENKTVRPMASAGFEEGYLQTLNVTWSDTHRGQGPTGTAIRTGKISMCRNMLTDPAFEPWRAEAIKRGYASSIVFPLIFGGRTFGTLSIYSKEPDPFSEDEVTLLGELASDLVYGIETIRSRIERDRAEETVKVSEVRYRRLFEAARDGILILDADSGQIVDVNPFIKEMLGYSHEELLDKKIWEIGLLKNIAASKESFLELQNKGFVRYENMPLETKDGHRISVEFVSNVYLVDHKKVIQCNIRDITARIRAEEALRQAHNELEKRVVERTAQLTQTVETLEKSEKIIKAERKRFEEVLEMMPAYAVLLTPDYHVAFANRTFRKWFGDDNGKRCYEFLFNRTEPCENCKTYDVLKTKKSQFWEWTGPNGRNYDIYDYPFTDVDGSPLIMEIGVDVTAHKKAQTALRQGEDRYRSLTEATTQIVWTTDAQGQVVGDMPLWREFTGQSAEEIMGWGWINSLHPDDRKETAEIWSNAVKNRTLYETEYRIRRQDGQYRYMSVRGVPVLEQDGNIREWVGTCTDITEQKQAQETLRSTSLYARGLLEASLDPLVTISADGKITDVNEATVKITDVSREKLIGTDFSNYFTEPQKAREVYQEVFAKGHVTDYPLTIRRKDGHLTDVLYNATVYNDTHGNVLGVFAAARDVTERKRAEKRQNVTNKLLEFYPKKTTRKEYLDSAIEIIQSWSGCSRTGIRIKDENDNIPYESSTGFEKEFLKVENSLNLGSDKCLCMRAILQQPVAADKKLLTSNGSFYINDSAAFVKQLTSEEAKDYRGNCMKYGFASIAVVPIRYRDKIFGAIHLADNKKDMAGLAKIQFLETTISPLIGEAIYRFNAEAELEKYRLHLEDIVKQRTEELARSNKDLEQFAYVASHDLQEPLRAVAGFVELLKMRLGKSLENKNIEYMNFAIDGVKRMQNLIHGLLEYSRIGTRSKPEPSDAKKAVNYALAHLERSIEESGAKITTDELPTIFVDQPQLVQLFQNLIGNGIKFRGDKPPQIHISVKRQEKGWLFGVKDNGIGIEQQYADRIFLIFQRLHSRDKYPGTGIGLSICKKIVERHGGKIWVESTPGQGSTFYFTVPDMEERHG